MARGKKKQTTVADQNLAVKYRIYPTAEQIVMFHKTFGCCRKIWNLMLEVKNRHYQEQERTCPSRRLLSRQSTPILLK